MKIEKSILESAIAKIFPLVSESPVLPILDTILIKSSGKNKILFAASNIRTTASITIKAAHAKPLQMCVNGKLLYNTLKNSPDQPIKLEAVKKMLRITTTSGVYEIAIESPDDFPTLPKADPAAELVDNFIPSIASVAFSAATDQLRINLTGIYISPEVIASTDAHRLTIIKQPIKIPKPITLPAEAAKYTSTIELPEQISIFATDNNLTIYAPIEDGEILISSKLIAEKYPDIAAVIPAKKKASISTLSRSALQAALSRIRIYSDQDDVFIALTKNELILRAKSATYQNQAKEAIDIDGNDKEEEHYINAKYVADALKFVADEDLQIETHKANILFYPVGDRSKFCLVMNKTKP